MHLGTAGRKSLLCPLEEIRLQDEAERRDYNHRQLIVRGGIAENLRTRGTEGTRRRAGARRARKRGLSGRGERT
jgi:hypothetical protein